MPVAMHLKSLAALTCLLTLSSTAPASKHGQPNFLIDNNFTITAGGTHGNQGAHVITPATVSRAISISNSLATRDGVGSVVTGAGLDWYNSDFSTGNSGYDDPQYYYCFKGPASNFPPLANWMNFYDMFDLNQNDQMVVSQNSLVDARFILAIIMQESTGNAYVGCTNNGVENCGLMQAYAGSVSFDPSDPQGSITQMVVDGTQGTSRGPGLVQGYNSGSIDFSNLSDGLGSTPSYASDIANRLQGWNGNDGEGYRAACGF
ncbi:hypothetical protein NA56DRAFT_683522 [Hyaloscypha hepaticicola]|uniref:Glycoside hydrolase family 23 protein n=1 Tax=Hyaloscypha hepaticicola TaxID=2082293 RepID=A0A2J6PD93_9HELO|nr:hypothetical protein NA56DRAFT_683522 [Hyaloscypha hepaticicola]